MMTQIVSYFTYSYSVRHTVLYTYVLKWHQPSLLIILPQISPSRTIPAVMLTRIQPTGSTFNYLFFFALNKEEKHQRVSQSLWLFQVINNHSFLSVAKCHGDNVKIQKQLQEINRNSQRNMDNYLIYLLFGFHFLQFWIFSILSISTASVNCYLLHFYLFFCTPYDLSFTTN